MSNSKRPASRRTSAVRAKPSSKVRRVGAKTVRAVGARPSGPTPVAKTAEVKAAAERNVEPRGASGKAARDSAAGRVCHLKGSLIIRDARASLAQLCEALESGCTCVDVSGVDTIDTSGVQLLLAAAMEWRRREQPLTLTGFEHLVFGAAEQLGLQTLLPIAAGVEP